MVYLVDSYRYLFWKSISICFMFFVRKV